MKEATDISQIDISNMNTYTQKLSGWKVGDRKKDRNNFVRWNKLNTFETNETIVDTKKGQLIKRALIVLRVVQLVPYGNNSEYQVPILHEYYYLHYHFNVQALYKQNRQTINRSIDL